MIVAGMSALAIAFVDRMNPFFLQERDGKTSNINVRKLRTVRPEAVAVPSGGSSSPPGVTKLGKLFRTIRFDELPQLINVLEGSMSMVGPRPLMLSEVEEYKLILGTKQFTEWRLARNNLKPGLCDPHCSQKYTDNSADQYEMSVKDRVESDIRFADETCFVQDLRVIKLTAVTLAEYGFYNPAKKLLFGADSAKQLT